VVEREILVVERIIHSFYHKNFHLNFFTTPDIENLKSGGRTRIYGGRTRNCGVLTRIYGVKTVDPKFFKKIIMV
jgi:hypothetical protein